MYDSSHNSFSFIQRAVTVTHVVIQLNYKTHAPYAVGKAIHQREQNRQLIPIVIRSLCQRHLST